MFVEKRINDAAFVLASQARSLN